MIRKIFGWLFTVIVCYFLLATIVSLIITVATFSIDYGQAEFFLFWKQTTLIGVIVGRGFLWIMSISIVTAIFVFLGE